MLMSTTAKSPAEGSGSQRVASIGLLLGGIAMAVGSSLPWAWHDTTTRENLFGLTTDGPLLGRLFDHSVTVKDGWLLLALGLAVVLLGGRSLRSSSGPRVALWWFVLATASLTIFEIAEYTAENGLPTYYTQAHDGLGAGLFVVAGGVMVAVAALVPLSIKREPRVVSIGSSAGESPPK